MERKRKDLVIFSVAAFSGLTIWLVIARGSGQAEAWDSPLFFRVGVPALVAVATAVGALRPGRAILWGFATIALQPVALLLMSEPSPLMAVGLIFFSVFALICALGAFIGGLLRISIARLLGKAKNGAPV